MRSRLTSAPGAPPPQPAPSSNPPGVILGQNFTVQLDRQRAHNLKELAKYYNIAPSQLSTHLLSVSIDSQVQMIIVTGVLAKLFICSL